MTRIPALLDIVLDACAREEQAFPLALPLDLFGGELLLGRRGALGGKRFHLAFDGLAFPTSCHDFIVDPRRCQYGAAFHFFYYTKGE